MSGNFRFWWRNKQVLSQCTVCLEKAQVLSQCTVWWEKPQVLPAWSRENQQRRQLQRSWSQGRRRPPENCDSCVKSCVFLVMSVWLMCEPAPCVWTFMLSVCHSGPYIWAVMDLIFELLPCMEISCMPFWYVLTTYVLKSCQNSAKTLSKFSQNSVQNSIKILYKIGHKR